MLDGLDAHPLPVFEYLLGAMSVFPRLSLLFITALAVITIHQMYRELVDTLQRVCSSLQSGVPPDRASLGVASVFLHGSFQTVSPSQLSMKFMISLCFM